MAGRTKAGMSYGELSDYQGYVDEVRKLALEIAKETRRYEAESGMVSDGLTFVSNVTPLLNKMKADLSKISAYSKKYGRL